MTMFDTSIQTPVAEQAVAAPVVDATGAQLSAIAGAVPEVHQAALDIETEMTIPGKLKEVEADLQGVDEQFSNISNALEKRISYWG